MGIRLRQSGFEDFVILEKAGGVGGTWYHNRYPGCECDVPSHLYSYSFDLKADWSKPYARQPEILEYVRSCADRYGVTPHCRFDAEVTRARWDDERSDWTLELASGEAVRADVVVSAIGMFNDLVYPDIEGLEDFEGTSFHSARWDWEHDLAGQTIGVIGSAASAVQLVPEIIREARQVHLFQRTANWVLPKKDDPFSEEQLEHLRAHPEAVRAIRQEIFDGIESGKAFTDPAARAEMEAAVLAMIERVEDPEVRAKLVPDHPWGCKRPLFSNDYYPAFNAPNLELVTERIERITPGGVVTEDGRERPVDTIVFATGFAATKYLSALDVTGREGLRIEDAWAEGAEAYLGMTTAGFPNLFMLYGPNTNQGSLITMIEWQVEHVLKHIQRIRDEGLAWIDVRPGPMAAYNADIQQAIEAIEPWQASCSNYYRAESGRVVTQWPHTMGRFRDEVEKIDLDVYEFRRRQP
jgi:cation diffusion facilitator CzcD-associated flavoprotein CzcO